MRCPSNRCRFEVCTRGDSKKSHEGGAVPLTSSSASTTSWHLWQKPRSCLLALAMVGVIGYGLLNVTMGKETVPWRRILTPEIVNQTEDALFDKNESTDYIPATVIPPSKWVKYGKKWRGYQLPVVSCHPVGRLGNVMGEYATLWALNRVYRVSVVLSPNMSILLNKTFPRISLPRHPGPFKRNEWQAVGMAGNLFNYNYALPEVAAAGLLGPHLFLMTDYAFEIQLFNLFKEDLRREFRFSDHIQVEVNKFLKGVVKMRKHRIGNMTSVVNSTEPLVYIGFHVRRTDYAKHAKKLFGANLPETSYFQRALNYYRSKFSNKVAFIAASDDLKFIKKELSGERDVFFAPGRSPTFDMALLSSCNHSIITMGSFGFWTGYLTGGEVVYPDVKLNRPYRFSRSMYEKIGLQNFTPLSPD